VKPMFVHRKRRGQRNERGQRAILKRREKRQGRALRKGVRNIITISSEEEVGEDISKI